MERDWIGFQFSTGGKAVWTIYERHQISPNIVQWWGKTQFGDNMPFGNTELVIFERAQIEREIKEMEEVREHHRRDQHPGIKWD